VIAAPEPQVPPQDLDAEEYVLGAMLLAPAAIQVAASELRTEDFYRECHGTIFRVALEMAEREDPVDVVTLADELDRRGLLAQVGGKTRVVELAAIVPATANVRHYATIVAERAKRRSLIRELDPMLTAVWTRGVEEADLLDAIERVRSLVIASPKKKALAEALALEDFIAAEREEIPTLLGSPHDAILPAGGLLILVGKAGVGKTTLALDLAFHLASGKAWLGVNVPRPLRVLLVENEGPREPFRRKVERKRSAWDHQLPGALFVHAEQWGSFTLADAGTRSRLRGFVEREAIDLVIGDPLGSLGVGGVGSPSDTREFVGRLREVGLLDRTAFVLLHHLRKESSEDELDELSGAWAGHADAILTAKVAGRDAVRLSFTKLRWGQPRDALILARDLESASFTVCHQGDPGRVGVAERIEDFLRTHANATTEEVIAGVRARAEDVRRELRTSPRFREVARRVGVNANAKCWGLADEPVQRSGTGWDGLSAAPPADSSSLGPTTPVGGGGRDGLAEGARPKPRENHLSHEEGSRSNEQAVFAEIAALVAEGVLVPLSGRCVYAPGSSGFRTGRPSHPIPPETGFSAPDGSTPRGSA
jgi:hypothetical protein